VFSLLAVAVAGPLDSWRPATCLPDDCFCEALRSGLIRQPANTWSSFAFALVALWVAARIRSRDHSQATVLPRAEAWLFVGSLTLVGFGSAFYHASLTFVGQVIDVSGMYLVATFSLLHRLGPRWRISPFWSVLGFVLVNALLMAAQVTTPSLRRVAFGVLLTSALVVEWRMSRRGRAWLGRGALLMILAFGVWVVDRARLVCDPWSVLQGHAVWHALGALAAACLFMSYEEETQAARAPSGHAPS
jgi:dihydroceramidase